MDKRGENQNIDLPLKSCLISELSRWKKGKSDAQKNEFLVHDLKRLGFYRRNLNSILMLTHNKC